MKLNKWKIRCLWTTLFVFLFSLGIGCANKEEKKAKHQERARQYIENQEYKKAVIELKNVIQLDPKDDAAYYQLGEAYLKLQQGQDAFQLPGHFCQSGKYGGSIDGWSDTPSEQADRRGENKGRADSGEIA
jgi:tetratricopeptide (TPR) repeat protein